MFLDFALFEAASVNARTLATTSWSCSVGADLGGAVVGVDGDDRRRRVPAPE